MTTAELIATLEAMPAPNPLNCWVSETHDKLWEMLPAIIAQLRRVEELERACECAKRLREIQLQRELDEEECAAAGQTYSLVQLGTAEKECDAAINAALIDAALAAISKGADHDRS